MSFSDLKNPRIYGRHQFSLFQVLVENWRKWRHFLKNTTRIEITLLTAQFIHCKDSLHRLISEFFSFCMKKRQSDFFKKIQNWSLKSERIRKRILTFFTYRNSSIQGLSNRDAWKEPKNPLWKWIIRSFDAPWSEWSWINLFNKVAQNTFSDSFGFKNPILDFLKETHPMSVKIILCCLFTLVYV